MTTKHTGGHAFPTQSWEYDEDQVLQYQEPGMSLRDWFAGLAMQGLIASNNPEAGDHIDEIPEYAYRIADAMLKAREEE